MLESILKSLCLRDISLEYFKETQPFKRIKPPFALWSMEMLTAG